MAQARRLQMRSVGQVLVGTPGGLKFQVQQSIVRHIALWFTAYCDRNARFGQ